MHAKRLSAFVALLPLMLAASAPLFADQTSPAVTPAARQAAAQENEFAFDLLRTLDHHANASNTFISPLSIDQAVSMLAAGSGGQTLAEIDHALHDESSAPGALAQAAALRDRLLALSGAGSHSLEINIANALWTKRGVMLRPAFVGACRNQLAAQASTLDFRQPFAVDTINRWVTVQTRGKIGSIVDQGELQDAAAVLTDAVYFHGIWNSPFELSATTNAPFHTASGTSVTLPMMTQTHFFPAAQTDAVQAVALPYGHSGLSMIVVLPREGHSLKALVGSMTPAAWNRLTSSLYNTNVQLFLPRFHIDYSADLVNGLTALGMRRVFTSGADLSPMSSSPLHVNAALHKTTLDVDEKGTVATAVTGIVMATSVAVIPTQPLTIRVDHPFLCAIRDDATGMLLFLGCVRNPHSAK